MYTQVISPLSTQALASSDTSDISLLTSTTDLISVLIQILSMKGLFTVIKPLIRQNIASSCNLKRHVITKRIVHCDVGTKPK